MGKFALTREYKGERPFRCPRCNKMAAVDIQGEFRLVIICARCHAKLTLETEEALPPVLAMKSGACINQ